MRSYGMGSALGSRRTFARVCTSMSSRHRAALLGSVAGLPGRYALRREGVELETLATVGRTSARLVNAVSNAERHLAFSRYSITMEYLAALEKILDLNRRHFYLPILRLLT